MIKPSTSKHIISVLVPIYNTSQYLHKCLYSIINQTYRDLEIICINDGSTDNSLDIIKEFAKTDKRITIIDKENSGYGDSMNRGLEKASGRYIGIVESDDFIAPDMYESLYALSNEGGVDIVKGNFYDYFVDGPGNAIAHLNNERKEIKNSAKPFTFKEKPEFSRGHPSVWSAIYKRDMIESHKIRFREVKGGGWVDNPFFFETLVHARSIMWTQKPVYYYLKTNPSSSSNFQSSASIPFERMHENLDVLEKNNFTDAMAAKGAYNRAFQYMTGVYKDFDCNQEPLTVCSLSRKLMERLDREIVFTNLDSRSQRDYLCALSPFTNIQATNPKVLIYNWVPFDNANRAGGGVNLYCRNLVNTFRYQHPNINIYFLSSGYAYDGETAKPFIRKINNPFFGKEAFWANVQQYEIVNSPIPAPIDKLLNNPTHAISNSHLKNVFERFIAEHGPFSAIHFNNIEGLSLDVLDLKTEFPDCRFIFSLHNYIPFCPHGFYYMRHKHRICSPDHQPSDCLACIGVHPQKNIADKIYKYSALFNKNPDACIGAQEWITELGIDKLDQGCTKERILDYCHEAVKKINKNCDLILAVSKKVKDLALQNGLAAEKLKVSYIGTEVALRQKREAAAIPENGILKIVFLGSSAHTEEKGFPFLLSALAALEEKYAERIDLLFTLRPPFPADIKTRLAHFRSLKIIKGYQHKDLPRIFSGCHLSIVPVLWEDNLPQIAIESAAFGVPVLASRAGGASELCESPLFSFEPGNSNELRARIIHFLETPSDLLEYWKYHPGLTTMSQHVSDLYKFYNLPEARGVSLSADEWNRLSAELLYLRGRH